MGSAYCLFRTVTVSVSSMCRPLRAYPISPRRLIPDRISRPDWASTVIPFSIRQSISDLAFK